MSAHEQHVVPWSIAAALLAASTSALAGTESQKLTPSDAEEIREFAYALSGAGDLDSDGYDDAIVGVHMSTSYQGAAYLYFGGPEGLRADREVKLLASDGSSGDNFGYSVSGGGDLNGDGYPDIVVGAMGDTGAFEGGALYVYLGSAESPSGMTELKVTQPACDDPDYLYCFRGFGRSVVLVGDVNGDGYDDLLTRAVRNESDETVVLLYLGAAGGLATEPSTQISGYGSSLAAAGDLNGDGLADFSIGHWGNDDAADNAGTVYVFFGRSDGDVAEPSVRLTASDATVDRAFGESVAGAGDVNGDGFDDLLIGAPGYDLAEPGSAYLYFGSASGPSQASEVKLTAAAGAAWDDFGGTTALAGDFNGDGYADVAVGAAFGGTEMSLSSGSVYLYSGGESGADVSSELELRASDGHEVDYFGASLVASVDVNGDGISDVLVGAPEHNGVRERGGALYVFLSVDGGVDTGGEDSGDTSGDDTGGDSTDTGDSSTDGGSGPKDDSDGGCGGCAVAQSPSTPWLLFTGVTSLLGLLRRRRDGQ